MLELRSSNPRLQILWSRLGVLIIVQCFKYNLQFADTVASAAEEDFVLAHIYQASIGA